MLRVTKWIIGAIICFPYVDQGVCYNPKLLDSLADSFNERICVKAPISTKLIQENLNFLQDEDTDYIEKYTTKNVFESYKKMLKDKGSPFSSFYQSCREIYDNHAEIDPLTQASVQMILERVSQKYEDHLNLRSSIAPFLPVIVQVDINESKNVLGQIKKSGLTPKYLFNELPSEYKEKFIIVITNIATNFFPEVHQGKLTLEELSSKCGTPLKELETTYSEYLHSK